MKPIVPAVLYFILGAVVPSPALADLQLQNDRWQIDIDPETFALKATVSGETPVPLSSGVGRQTVSELLNDATSATWRWDKSGYAFSVELEDTDLKISVSAASAGSLDLMDMPPAAIGRGLILPHGEGYYAAATNPLWRDFLIEQLSPANTSQDLSLPMLGMDHGSYTLNWIWRTPFNNAVAFAGEGDGLRVRFAHEFTGIGERKPFEMTLHLGGQDLLSGAKRYRRMLIADGRYEPLADKLSPANSGSRLLGAPQLYLWGNGPIGLKDVKDWAGFVKTLSGSSPLAEKLRKRFDAETRKALKESPRTRYANRVVLAGVNQALAELARAEWQTDRPDWKAMAGIYAGLRADVRAVFARSLSGDGAGWGETLSRATFAALRKAGISKAWIGVADGWEGGLWNPEAVQAAVDSGFLIAPYDSYQTALPTGFRPDWTTAALGRNVYEECAVIRRDGSPQPGFQKAGHYTATGCVRPTLEARTSAVLDAVPFNSWFLDAYATGMVFDSYATKAPQTMEQNARENEAAARWLAGRFSMPVASEDGNATTAGGIALAHGMQVPVFGWGDEEMMKDRASPYYLGRWYPDNEPEFFFKPVPVKEPFRTLLFGPANRLPLYQSVFHGSVITANHWHTDSLKLSNVRREAELMQLLYNVPPLYHLSQNTLKKRLPVIARQQAFFQPLHERLATQELVSFRYLSDDRRVQETAFADGTRLIANTAGESRTAEGETISAFTIIVLQNGKKTASYQSRED